MSRHLAGRIVVVLIAVHAVLITGAAQTPPQADDRVVREAMALITDMSRAPKLDEWLQANKSRITPEVAAAAGRIGAQQAMKGEARLAAAAFDFASLAYLQLGDRVQALDSMFDRQQIAFMVASKPDEYAEVRETSLGYAKRAESIGEANLRLSFITLAADSAFFQSEAASGDAAEAALLTSLHDLILATNLARTAGTRDVVERLVSLTGGAVGEAMSKLHRDQETFNTALRQLAGNAEQVIPVDFDFTVQGLGDRAKAISTAKVLAELSYTFGNPGLASARLAVAEQRAADFDAPELIVGILNMRYRGESRHGGTPESLRRLRETAWSKAQAIRSQFRSRAGRIWAVYVSDELYGEMLKGQITLGSAGQLSDTFRWSESLKARALLDRLSLPAAVELDTDRARELEQTILGFNASKPDDDLLMGEMRLVSQLSGFANAGDDRGRRTGLRDIEALYATSAVGFTTAPAPKTLESIQGDLQPGEALLEYVIPPNALHPASDLLIVLMTRAQVWRAHVPLDDAIGTSQGFIGRMAIDGQSPVDSSPLSDLIALTRVAIQSSNGTEAKQRLRRLHELLVQPLLQQGVDLEAFSRVIVVPHGPLHYVPFPALVDRQGAFLISQVPITIAPSASVWSLLQARASSADRLVVFANPELQGRDLRNLAFAEQEATRVGQTAPVSVREVYPGARATKDQFLRSAPGASVLHVATHGEFPDASALDLHSLWLGAPYYRGIGLRAGEVRRLNLTGTKLVVLSVCNGGLYRIGPSDEPYGLMPAFLEAGAQNVMGTLWSLDDQFGRDFMIEFYSHLREGPAKAFQLTAQRFIAEDEHIRRWAGFVTVGPGRPF